MPIIQQCTWHTYELKNRAIIICPTRKWCFIWDKNSPVMFQNFLNTLGVYLYRTDKILPCQPAIHF